ncbi:hypothetical protein DPMN_033836 [Dreissena polymorpha]|uniref:Uncharacterized protein n=1 Tax=Dreissena polymorpha TaxID=45954 RepID=A0A9D4M591_DREPO|nr:hypothetical protein DPMN_033661 [Dreissena polymorpha]KAH3870648.1 hypothetical protein DPMN_033836 [Dreissena polymorpha]
MLFFAFPSHQRPGLWRSARPHGVLNPSLATLPRSYCVSRRPKPTIRRLSGVLGILTAFLLRP